MRQSLIDDPRLAGLGLSRRNVAEDRVGRPFARLPTTASIPDTRIVPNRNGCRLVTDLERRTGSATRHQPIASWIATPRAGRSRPRAWST